MIEEEFSDEELEDINFTPKRMLDDNHVMYTTTFLIYKGEHFCDISS